MSGTRMQLEDWLDDLCVRFIINLPREELESVERICFQVEEAQWFYEDFIRPLDPALPSLSLKAFALRIFQHCPLMSQWSHYHHITAFSEFLAYKTRVPVRGAILLNQEMDEVVLVKGWKKSASWSFPRGKINKGEKDIDCAIREVYEETGFDVREAGLVKDEADMKFIEITMREQHMRLYVFRGVPHDAHFEPRTRKEISKIEWYKLSELPTLKKSNKQQDPNLGVVSASKFYMVAPFMHPLRKWIAQQRKIEAKLHAPSAHMLNADADASLDEGPNGPNGSMATPLPDKKVVVMSDLPEVAPLEDVSVHLKRMLNINEIAANQGAALGAKAMHPSRFDSTKSNALLALLRDGSHTARQQNLPTEAPPPRPSLPQDGNRSRSAHIPGFFPGFPPQAPQATVHGHIPQGFSRPSHGHVSNQHPPNHPPQYPHSSLTSAIPTTDHRADGQAYPQIAPPVASGEYPGFSYPHGPATPLQTFLGRPGPSPASGFQYPQRLAPAPYQRTGDPQFAQGPQSQSRVQEAAIPRASQLPPPKLTSHSLTLLNFFKDSTSKPSTISHVSTSIDQSPGEVRKFPQHQESLLGLFRSSTTSTEPAELSAHPVAQTMSKQILQRPRVSAASSVATPSVGEGQTSATVSGPMNMPYFEAIAKPMPRKGANGTSTHTKKQPLPQTLASPITILSRAQKTESKTPPPTQATRTPPRVPASDKPRSADVNKPFQPQILRRGEKPMPDISPPAQAANLPPQASPYLAPQPSTQQNQMKFDRRPSQTAAQKETLLSLFGNSSAASGSPTSAAGPSDMLPPRVKAGGPNPLGHLSPSHGPSKPSSLSGHATPSDPGSHVPSVSSVASPVNKAFLLGFLEDVAKGQK